MKLWYVKFVCVCESKTTIDVSLCHACHVCVKVLYVKLLYVKFVCV